ncbi:MAG: hypothetical protein KJP25_09970 [Gammaproteobacteria bacterium]|nr:hypothetical protein [Gammaproteobacteria bacterium]MBT8149852.1 hypothetical protein [Gammaproteobacteria bacterium]NNM11592.1 hypothetical protein [Pseudomonadales bacterium]
MSFHSLRKWALAIVASIVASLVLTGCSSGSKGSADLAEGQCPTVGDLVISFVNALGSNGFCLIGGTLTQSAVLPAGTDWRLDGTLQVGSAASAATLSIQAGATLRGDADSSVPEYLYVFPGASLLSIGSASAPIIFSSNDDDYDLDPGANIGEWGGIIIEENDSDQGDSRLEYTIVAEAGALVAVAKGGGGGSIDYTANLSLQGPHNNTRLRYVQSHASGGDGFYFGSDSDSANNSARAEWLLVTGASRDGIAYSQFEGLLKDLLVVHAPGEYLDASGLGGRAGIRAAGADAAPLITNATLFGADNENKVVVFAEREFGLLFEDATNKARLANIAIVNFRNGCYAVESDVDLSAMLLNASPVDDTNFVDGVHCINEFIRNDPSDPVFIQSGGAGINLDPADPIPLGLQIYAPGDASFAGETSSATDFSANWYMQAIAGIDNENLNRYNDGDTNDSGAVTTADKNFRPLFNSDADPLFGGVVVSSVESSRNSSGFDLTVVGAIRSESASEAAQFDGWILQDGAVDPVVTGFTP